MTILTPLSSRECGHVGYSPPESDVKITSADIYWKPTSMLPHQLMLPMRVSRPRLISNISVDRNCLSGSLQMSFGCLRGITGSGICSSVTGEWVLDPLTNLCFCCFIWNTSIVSHSWSKSNAASFSRQWVGKIWLAECGQIYQVISQLDGLEQVDPVISRIKKSTASNLPQIPTAWKGYD